MNTKQLAGLLEKVGAVLAEYPNSSLDSMLDDVLKKVRSGKGAKSKKTNIQSSLELVASSPDEGVSEDVSVGADIFELPEELRKFLPSHDSEPTLANLRVVALKLGVNSSSRQSKSSLIHSLLKAIERGKMDQTISQRNTIPPGVSGQE